MFSVRPKPAKKTMQLIKKVGAIDVIPNGIYWVKLRGYCAWPGVIESVECNGRVCVHFFGDYTKSTITQSNIFADFENGFLVYNDGPKTNVKLAKAVAEASLFSSTRNKRKNSKIECAVCQIVMKM